MPPEAATDASTPLRRGIDPQALMRARSLELRARHVVEGFWHGLHRSPYHGFSVEFTEYRAYTPGDDPRYLDWRLAARTDRYFIKKFEDETNLRCHLLVDCSRSLQFGTLGYTKADYAHTLAATLGYFLDQQGDAVGLLTFDNAVREILPARHRPGHVRELMLMLDRAQPGPSTELAAPLRRAMELLRKRGLLVVISDFLAPLDALEGPLGTLTAAGHEVMLFQVLDPAERDFEFRDARRFKDLESGTEMFLEPETARSEYLRRLNTHQDGLRALCRKWGIGFRSLGTDQPLDAVLYDFLKARSQPGVRQVRRRAR